MKKKAVAGRVRAAVITVCSGLFLASLFCLALFWRQPSQVERREEVYRYWHKGELGYHVRVRPNSIYREVLLSPGKVYFTKLVEGIPTSFSYRFEGDGPAVFRGSYGVTATVEAPQMWRKDFILVPPAEISARGRSLTLRRDFAINLEYFHNFLNAVIRETGASPYQPRLVVQGKVNLRVTTSKGEVKEALSPELVIPLTQGDFKVGGQPLIEEKKVLTRAATVRDPGVGRRRIGAALFSLLAAILLGVILCFTRSRPPAIKDEKEQIWRRYRDRFVRAERGGLLITGANLISLGSIEELVKVADELGKPLVYCLAEESGVCPVYLVFDGATLYRYLPRQEGVTRA